MRSLGLIENRFGRFVREIEEQINEGVKDLDVNRYVSISTAGREFLALKEVARDGLAPEDGHVF